MDDRKRRELEAQFSEIYDDMRELERYINEAREHLKRSDLQNACNLIALSHTKIAAVSTDRAALVAAFEALGVVPGSG